MIIVRLIGGIGNQMFQYALGRCLAQKNNTELKLDISDFYKYPDRKYMLDIFNIEAKIATQDEINELKSRNYVKEKNSYFDETILNLPDNIYLEGYWQSEKYFKDIEDIIRKEFSFKEQPDEKNQKVLDNINNTNSVCIHFRRGDYTSSLRTKLFHGFCSNNYYKNGMKIIQKNVTSPHFFIFSDEPEWVREHLKINYEFSVVDINPPEKGYEDLRLMLNCKHFIIANSTFSWWGAWLASNPRKNVIAPKKWFGIISPNRKINPSLEIWLKI